MKYDWQVLDITKREIRFQLDFENPKAVSANSIDKLTFQIVKFSAFESEEGEVLEKQNFKAAKG
jgi:hypothetical protein